MTGYNQEDQNIEIRTAYCSACDHNVRVVVSPRARKAGADADASDLVCLEYGEKCTGDMCPLFNVPSDQMREELERLLRESGPQEES